MFNLPNGLSQLTNAIAKQLNAHIQLDCQIKKIEKKDSGYIIIDSQGYHKLSKYYINTSRLCTSPLCK